MLRLLATGASNRAIAAELVVSIPTGKTHVSCILDKPSGNPMRARRIATQSLRVDGALAWCYPK
ncbi:MAG: hypothetical protein AAF702_29610 [Chloroflexota bacterium]